MTNVISDVIGRKADFRTVRSALTTVELLTRIPDYPVRIMLRAYQTFHVKGGEFNDQTLYETLFGKAAEVK